MNTLFMLVAFHFVVRVGILIKVENGRKKFRCDSFRFPLSFIRFRICGPSRKGFFRPFPRDSVFYPELTRIYSVFYPVFNLCEICLEIDMFINLLITNYAC